MIPLTIHSSESGYVGLSPLSITILLNLENLWHKGHVKNNYPLSKLQLQLTLDQLLCCHGSFDKPHMSSKNEVVRNILFNIDLNPSWFTEGKIFLKLL